MDATTQPTNTLLNADYARYLANGSRLRSAALQGFLSDARTSLNSFIASVRTDFSRAMSDRGALASGQKQAA